MSMRSTHLVAYASLTTIPATGTWTQVTLLDPKGVAIPGNVLPAQCTMVQFGGGTGYALGVDASATPTWMQVAQAQADQLDVVLGGAGKKVAVMSHGTALNGAYTISFYA